MPIDQNKKQLVVERIKNASNILVTVSRNPSVDELAAALAFTLMLDKLDKSATAVFSGAIPPAIEFLEPGKTFENNVDSLRDFIIALDKEKADRLRYKVEEDVVRVFITPYKTTISESDLSFSQGDFNVDLVVALGVDNKEDLDVAIAAHGRILHDSSVVSINMIPGQGSLGEIDWSDPEASSLCEMLMSLSEALQNGLLDQPIATALLTGLVSSTDRFRNEKTSPKVMTMSAQLMAAGANQQLIAEKLEAAGGGMASDNTSLKIKQEEVSTDQPEVKAKDVDGEMKIGHHDDETVVEQPTQQAAPTATTLEPSQVNQVPAEPSVSQPVADQQATETKAEDNPQISPAKYSSWRDMSLPTIGGTLNATTEAAEEDRRTQEEDEKNRVLLSHDQPPVDSASSVNPQSAVLNSSSLPSIEPPLKDIFATSPGSYQTATTVEPVIPAPVTLPPSDEPPVDSTGQATVTDSAMNFEETPLSVTPQPVVNQTLADLEEEVKRQADTNAQTNTDTLSDARSAVEAALGAQDFNPSGRPLNGSGAQPFGQISHDPASVPPPAFEPQSAVEPSATVSPTLPPPLPTLPPLPDFSTLPPLPGEAQPYDQPLVQTPPTVPNFGLPEQQITPDQTNQATTPEPGEFQLPGQ